MEKWTNDKTQLLALGVLCSEWCGIHSEVAMEARVLLWELSGKCQNCLLVIKEGNTFTYFSETDIPQIRAWYGCMDGKVNLDLTEWVNQLKRSWKKMKASNPRISLFPHNFFNGAHPLLHHHLTMQTIFLVLRHAGAFVWCILIQ